MGPRYFAFMTVSFWEVGQNMVVMAVFVSIHKGHMFIVCRIIQILYPGYFQLYLYYPLEYPDYILPSIRNYYKTQRHIGYVENQGIEKVQSLSSPNSLL